MNAKQQSKIRMLLSPQAVLATNQEVFKNLAGFVETAEELDTVIGQIQNVAQLQESRSGGSESKAQALRFLGDAAYEVAAATYAWARASGDAQLARRMSYARSEVTQGREVAMVARCQDIHAAATECLGSLADYGVTAAKLTNLKKRIEAFQEALTKARQDQAESTAATKALPKLLSLADTLLRDRLDKLVFQFKAANEDFYNKYTTARVIVDRAGGRSEPEQPANVVTPPATTATSAGSPLPQAA